MAYKNILFDLDGTLTDSCSGIVNALKYSLDKMGIQEDDTEKLKSFIGSPLVKLYPEHYGFSDEDANRAVVYFREYYAEKGIYENTLYEGIDALLKGIKSSGRLCILATSKLRRVATEVLAYLKIDRYFDEVAGSNPDGTLSEKDELIQHVIERGKYNRAETVMIGDRKFDISGARKNGIDSIAVMYGYGTKEELEKAGPTYFSNSVSGIMKIVLHE